MSAAVLAAAAIAVTFSGMFTGTAQAETNPKCPSGVKQIGATKYLKRGSETVASVKQFIGCNKNWAYTYVWDSWKARHNDFTATAAVVNRGGDGGIDYVRGNRGQQEVWSSGANTVNECTIAWGTVLGGGYNVAGGTEERC